MKNLYSKKDNVKLWNSYHSMKKRCLNINCKRYKDYGGRGITICDEWLVGFDNFAKWAYEHGYEEGLTIERINVDGNYEPLNCKWITKKEQALNTRKTIWITYKGETKQLKKWCEELGLLYDTMNDRIVKRGWPPEKAFNQASQRENSFSQKCKEVGLNSTTVYCRIHDLGWDEEKAFDTKSKGRGANQFSY